MLIMGVHHTTKPCAHLCLIRVLPVFLNIILVSQIYIAFIFVFFERLGVSRLTLLKFTPSLKQYQKTLNLKATVITIQRLKKKQPKLCCCIVSIVPIGMVLISVGLGIQTLLMKHPLKTRNYVDGNISFG